MDPVTITGIIFTGGVVASLVGLHAAKVQVPRLGRWRNAPAIYVEIPGPVTVEEVAAAAAWWRDKGFAMGEVRRIEAVDVSVQQMVPGAIVVGAIAPKYLHTAAQGHAQWLTEHPLEEDELDGITSRVTDVVGAVDDGFIRHARVGVRFGLTPSEKTRTLRHELGHALGFAHCQTPLRLWKTKRGPRVVARKKGHVMHPELAHVGTSTAGMEPQ